MNGLLRRYCVLLRYTLFPRSAGRLESFENYAGSWRERGRFEQSGERGSRGYPGEFPPVEAGGSSSGGIGLSGRSSSQTAPAIHQRRPSQKSWTLLTPLAMIGLSDEARDS